MHLLKILKTVKRLLGRLFFGRSRLKALRNQRVEYLSDRQHERNLAIIELRRRTARLPVREMSEEDLQLLPEGKEIDLNTCALGTWFVCTPHKDLPVSTSVLGHVVDGMDALADQYGSGMSVPPRFINRYRLKVVVPYVQIQVV